MPFRIARFRSPFARGGVAVNQGRSARTLPAHAGADLCILDLPATAFAVVVAVDAPAVGADAATKRCAAPGAVDSERAPARRIDDSILRSRYRSTVAERIGLRSGRAKVLG
jgi:hypothetical protein